MPEPYNFNIVEPEILKFWEKSKIHAKANKKNKGKEVFYFLEGPPYTSGKVHLGTAWNKALKDLVLRYKRMNGFDVYDRSGYDMHGLPTEHATMKRINLKTKEDILKFGVKKFIEECRKTCTDNMKEMNKEFIRVGVWMDFENAYQTIAPEWTESVWWLVKTAHEKGRLYEGERALHWCPNCESALAKHELEYKDLTDMSIYMKFQLKGAKNEYMIIWTTTPWTTPLNLSVVVHPEFDYVKCKVGDEIWIVAKKLAKEVINKYAKKEFEIVETFKGAKLKGKEYIPLFDKEFPELERRKKEQPLYKIILSKEHVHLDEGTGIVHLAPGCGDSNYDLCIVNGVKPFNVIDTKGRYPLDHPTFKGWTAKVDDKKFAGVLEERGKLAGFTQFTHSYPHCQRCKTAAIFRTTPQWFFKVEDLKPKMIAENKKITWQPVAAFNAFNAWLENLRDNSITKQRFWGTPIPIWRCDACKEYDVIGSIAELKKKSGKTPKDLHKPDIDKITYKCKCGKTKKRLPDVLDVWLDPGSASWANLGYPQEDKLFKKLFPSDFILEGNDQIRGWFNLLHVASMITMGKLSFTHCYMHGMINDSQGRKMSKSLGNYILPGEVYEKYGADTFRYYAIGGANPALDLNYNFDDVKSKYRNLVILWNVHNYLLDLCKNNKINPTKLKIQKKALGREEKYMLSKLNSTVRTVTDKIEQLLLNEVPWIIEDLFLELSRTYIQLTRDKASIGKKQEKTLVAYTIYNVLINTLKLFAVVAPMITEKMYQDLKEAFSLKEASIHHFAWPSFDEKEIDESLEKDMEVASKTIQAVHAAREKSQIGSRWPLSEVIVVTDDKEAQKSLEKSKEIIMNQTNVKAVNIKDTFSEARTTVKADFKKLGPDFGELAPRIVAALLKESAEAIQAKLNSQGKYEMKIDNKKVNIVKEHLIFQREVPIQYQEEASPYGFVYLNKAQNDALEAEGFAREIMRRIQSLRKEEGLQKIQSISLFIKVDQDLEKRLKKWQDAIKEKVGATQMKISTNDPAKKHKVSSQDKVKDKEISLFFDVVK
ncbi:MAG: isoleucine--tRNA ligase [Candidatus Woesearchaeota archaeon]|jgi:isoleucyl-tRNA synthetase|nr:isoleucine--tRNA ligase [Candidatus Woesearchaeota archaeon]